MIRRRYLRNRARGNIVYPGLIAAWSAKGKTNDDKNRAILKDLTGNGHDITLNGFAFSEMSGYGGYSTNFLNWNKQIATEVTHNKIIMRNISSFANWANNKNQQLPNGLKINVFGITDETVNYRYSIEEGSMENNILKLTNGINILPPCYSCNFFSTTVKEECNIVIELIPEYPDALVFDGVNDYGFCTNIPLLEDYTIIAKRKDCSKGCLFTKGVDGYGAFVLEGYSFINNTYNYGRGQNKNLLLNNTITWQNKNSYNQQNLSVGNKSDTTNRITIGVLHNTDGRYLKGAFYFAYLFDRSLDEQEIKVFIRKYIDANYVLPSEQTT